MEAGFHLYLQFADELENDILSGRKAPGQKLPSIREMASLYGVNPNTIQRGLLKSNSCIVILRTRFSFCLEKAKGVGALPILPHFKMKMVAGGISGGTHIADHFALFHFLYCFTPYRKK